MKTLIFKKVINVMVMMSAMNLYAQSQTDIIWSRQFGTDKEEYAMNHVIDHKANIYISGKTTGNMDGINFGKNDGFITKVDSSGIIKWSKQFGTSEDEDIQWSAIDNNDCIYITGSTTGSLEGKNYGKEDIFIVKYSPDGQLMWSRQFGTDSSDIGKGIFADNKGYIYITGTTKGKLGKSSFGSTDGFIMKIDNSGNKLFAYQFGTPVDDFSNAITGDNNSTIYICGSTWGDLSASNKGFMDLFTGKFTDKGDLIKFNQLGSEGFDFAMNLAVDNEKNLYVAGSTSGNFGGLQTGEGDCFLTKISDQGEILWNNQFGTKNHDGVRSITFIKDNSGDILISGLQNLPPAKAFVRMYKRDGSLVWERIIAGTNNEEASGKDVSVDKLGNIYHLGLTGSNLFGTLTGEHDLFLVKLKK